MAQSIANVPRYNQLLSDVSTAVHVISGSGSFILALRHKFLLFHTVRHRLEANSILRSLGTLSATSMGSYCPSTTWPISNVFSRHGSPRRSPISPYAPFTAITLYVILVSHARTSTLSCGMGKNLSRVELHWELEQLVAQTFFFVLRLLTGTSYNYISRIYF